MKKKLIVSVFILVISFIRVSVSAQDTISNNKIEVEFALGLNLLGPQKQMADLMRTNGYDDPSSSWLSSLGGGGPTTHPHYSGAGFTAHFTISYRIALKSQLGIRLNYSTFGTTYGYSRQKGYLSVGFSNFSFIPLYTFSFGKNLELQSGPSLMINSGKNDNSGGNENENYTQLSVGLLLGLNVRLWDRPKTFGKLGANYQLTYGNKMGPYTSSGSYDVYTLPESKINFSHLSLVFVLGFNQ